MEKFSSRFDRSCFKEDDDLTNAIYDAMEAYIAGDIGLGDAKFAEAKPLYIEALSDC